MRQPYNGDASLEARVRVVEALMGEREKTLTLTAELLNIRVDHLNKLSEDMLPRLEYAPQHKALEEKIGSLGKLGIGILIALIASLLAALFALLKHQP